MSLQVRGARWSPAGRPVLDGVDLDAAPGEVLGLLGPNGSGKSSLLRLVAGVPVPGPRPDGVVAWRGADLRAARPRERARVLALVEQDAHTELDLTVRDVVTLGRIPHRRSLVDRRRAPRLVGARRAPGPGDAHLAPRPGDARPAARPGTDDATAVTAALAAVGLTSLADRRLATLSGGERQRVHLARGLAQEPSLLLLDEPTNHLDVRAQLDVLGLVREATQQRGLTAVVAVHDLNLAARYCDRVVLLSQGRVASAGRTDEVLVPDVVDRVYGVRSARVDVDGTAVLAFRPAAG